MKRCWGKVSYIVSALGEAIPRSEISITDEDKQRNERYICRHKDIRATMNDIRLTNQNMFTECENSKLVTKLSLSCL